MKYQFDWILDIDTDVDDIRDMISNGDFDVVISDRTDEDLMKNDPDRYKLRKVIENHYQEMLV